MSDQLPDYKANFMREMEEIRHKKHLEHQAHLASTRPLGNKEEIKVPENRENILYVDTQYNGSDWRSNLNQTYYRKQHNETHFHINELLNPEIAKKKHNMRVTQISEYSNARHNNTVFVNPKNTSC